MSIRSKVALPFIATIIIFVIASCSKSAANCGTNVDCSTVTYAGTIQPLVDSKCNIAGCHAGQFSSYIGLKNAADNGSLYDQVVGSENMPAGGVSMTCEQRGQIECWINAGAPDN